MKRQKNAGFKAELIGRILALHPSTGDEIDLRAIRLEMFKDGIKGAEFTKENQYVIPNTIRQINRHPTETRFRLETHHRGNGHRRGTATFHWLQAAMPTPVKREQIIPMNIMSELVARIDRCELMLAMICREWGIAVPEQREAEWTSGGCQTKNEARP